MPPFRRALRIQRRYVVTVGGTPAVTANVLVSAARSITISMTARMPKSLKGGVGSASRVAPVLRERFAVPGSSHFELSRSGIHSSDPKAGQDKLAGTTIFSKNEIPSSLLSGTNVALPSLPQIMDAIEVFFSRICPLPLYSFLHKETLIRQINAGIADPAIILAVCGVSAQLHSSIPAERGRSEAWTDAAERLIMTNLHSPSIFRLQALLLVTRQRLEAKMLSKAFMLTALASRFAFALRLNYERPKLGFSAQECRRRLMWSVFLLDGLWSGGLNEFTTCSFETVHLELPSSEKDFKNCVPPLCHEADPQSETYPDLLAPCLRLSIIRRDILKYTKMTLWEPDTPEALQESVRAFERRLHEFQSELSLSASFCAENLEYYASTPWLTRYIHIHTSWHQANCDIFRFFLAGYKEAIPQSLLNRIDPEFVLYAMEKCLAHAVAMTDVFSSVLQLDRELPPMDNDIAICAYHCTRVILYCLRNNVGRNPLTLEAGLRRASVCLQAVTRIFGMSPAPRIMREAMEKMLSCFKDSETLDDDSALPDTDNNNPAPVSNAARIRQKLSIHSLVRQASFVDDSPIVASAAVSKEQSITEPSRNETTTSKGVERYGDSNTVPDPIIGGGLSVDNGLILQNTEQALDPGLIWQNPFQQEQGSLDFFIESEDQHWRDAWALFDGHNDASLWNLEIP
ncbi:3-dehydroquinate dehydratase I [Rasamsonia emersonii CBS 393.64]|uniref:3-dehydroquinate dehydratase I n=1 Tax=Rasamsonia emersonii (strain ATCC 16479 / CBS 393.64 / IMI 116815) TaxID=1408163 RepID=A0A0F4YFF4_RASE3|nr:3-dehydroquinate dehydratase I [Rasamsonia emersonii CBS 393.64]KKA16982.1 3-dehydroquinate dehydratase I [Rasamsonia emersonii CBS 393.64]